MYSCDELFMRSIECYFGVYFPRCCATREINTKITPSWAHRQFVTRVHTLFYIYTTSCHTVDSTDASKTNIKTFTIATDTKELPCNPGKWWCTFVITGIARVYHTVPWVLLCYDMASGKPITMCCQHTFRSFDWGKPEPKAHGSMNHHLTTADLHRL